jgi:hypothetical protein
MAIKCSLLGHNFGESTVERDREEQGSEVIITITETEVCERCGEERVVSQNKEVTSLEMPHDVEPGEAVEAAKPDTDDGGDDAPPEPADEDVEVIDGEGPADAEPAADHGEDSPETDTPDEAEPADPVAEAESDPETDPVESDEPPVTDDAEILDDGEEPEREPGEWPQEAEPETTRDEEDFDQYGYMDEDEESTVDEDATDAEIIDEGPEDAAEEGEDGEPAAVETNAWPSEDESVVESESAGPGAVTVPEGEFVCEACGFSTPVEESSLRAGDFCPECHKETLVQVRER